MSGEVAVVILAGGGGTRIGGGKPLRTLRGERLIDHALSQAKQWSDLVAVAVRSAAQVQPVEAELLSDRPDIEGPVGGLISALEFAQENGRGLLLTIPADMPFLPADLPDRLSPAIGKGGCALASSGGHVHPVCGLWRTTVLLDVPAYLETGRRSLRGLAELGGMSEVEWPNEPADPFFNINRAEDLSEAERLF